MLSVERAGRPGQDSGRHLGHRIPGDACLTLNVGSLDVSLLPPWSQPCAKVNPSLDIKILVSPK